MLQYEFAETPDPKRRYLCRHVFTEGRRCGSPALRGQHFCYYHQRSRRLGPSANNRGELPIFAIPAIDDPAAIQIALRDVLTRIAGGELDNKRAGILLYGLQVASSNLALQLRTAHTQAVQTVDGPFMEQQQRCDMSGVPNALVEYITVDPHAGDLAPLAELPSTPEPAAAVDSAGVVANDQAGVAADSAGVVANATDLNESHHPAIEPVILSEGEPARKSNAPGATGTSTIDQAVIPTIAAILREEAWARNRERTTYNEQPFAETARIPLEPRTAHLEPSPLLLEDGPLPSPLPHPRTPALAPGIQLSATAGPSRSAPSRSARRYRRALARPLTPPQRDLAGQAPA